jgi:integrase/recombinase XerD
MTMAKWILHMAGDILGRRGTSLTPSGLDQALYRIRGEIGLRDVRLSAHTFRHSFARVWLERGGEVYSLSRLLGHTSVQVTEVYLRDFEARQARLRHNEFSPLADLPLPRGKRGAPSRSAEESAASGTP